MYTYVIFISFFLLLSVVSRYTKNFTKKLRFYIRKKKCAHKRLLWSLGCAAIKRFTWRSRRKNMLLGNPALYKYSRQRFQQVNIRLYNFWLIPTLPTINYILYLIHVLHKIIICITTAKYYIVRKKYSVCNQIFVIINIEIFSTIFHKLSSWKSALYVTSASLKISHAFYWRYTSSVLKILLATTRWTRHCARLWEKSSAAR